MKKFFLIISLILCAGVMAADISNIPASITIVCGNLSLRLDKAKLWNINSVKIKNELVGVDNPGAHYGMTHMLRGGKGFIGSGHKETGVAEKIKSIRFFINGAESKPAEKMVAKTNFHMEKISIIGNFESTYCISMENDILHESIKLVCLDEVKLGILYCFMHPWTTTFKKYYGITPDGKPVAFDMSPNGKFPNQRFLPKIAMLNPATGTALATEINFLRGKNSRISRLMWTRPVYNKDYIVAASNTVLPKGMVIELIARTVFFKSSPENFAEDAEKIFLLN